MKELQEIQQALFVPKSNRNTHGNFNYRSSEDILTAVKPLIKAADCFMFLNTDIVLIGERYYVKAIATFRNPEGQEVAAYGFAR